MTELSSGTGPDACTELVEGVNVSDIDDLRRDVRATLMPGFVGFTPPKWLLEALGDGAESQLQAVCVYGGNVRDSHQLRSLGKALRDVAPGALIAIDEEGGEVTRLHYLTGSPYPGAAVLGRIDDTDYTAEIGARVGRDLLAHGFNLTLAPDVDVNSNPKNPVIGTRSFGADPELVSRHAAAWVRGLESTGATACPKHFPGHGDTSQDSHLKLPVVNASHSTLSERDLPPFVAAFTPGARAVMTSHILLPEIDSTGPATFSRVILNDILRGELGFTGVVISDALDMQGASHEIGIPEAAVQALNAGCDLLCIGTGTTQEQLLQIESRVLAAVHDGRLDEARVRDAAARVRELAAASAPGSASSLTPSSDSDSDSGSRRSPSAVNDVVGKAEMTRIAGSFEGVESARAWLAAHPRASVIRVDVESNMAVGFAPWGPFAARSMSTVREAARAFEARPLRAVNSETPLPWLAAATVSPADGLGVNYASNSNSNNNNNNTAQDTQPDGVIVIGRNMHHHPFAREGIDSLRASGAPVLTIETGWPAATTYRAEDSTSDSGADADADAANSVSVAHSAGGVGESADETVTSNATGYADLATYGSSAIVGAALLELFAGKEQE